MTALTADFDPKRQSSDIYSAHVKASTSVWAGSMVMRVTASGLVEPAQNVTASTHFAGVAKDKVTGNAAGTSDIDLYKTGIYEFAIASASITSIGLTLYYVDDQTVGVYANKGTAAAPCGKIVDYISSTKVKVCIDGYAEGHANGLGEA